MRSLRPRPAPRAAARARIWGRHLMAHSPMWKVFNATGKYVASCKYPEDAAAIVATYGDGAEIRFGHRKKDVMWREGEDGFAGDSYDSVAAVCRSRLPALRERWRV
jgi:hypothetical protein